MHLFFFFLHDQGINCFRWSTSRVCSVQSIRAVVPRGHIRVYLSIFFRKPDVKPRVQKTRVPFSGPLTRLHETRKVFENQGIQQYGHAKRVLCARLSRAWGILRALSVATVSIGPINLFVNIQNLRPCSHARKKKNNNNCNHYCKAKGVH